MMTHRFLASATVIALAACAHPEETVPDNGLPSLAADQSNPRLALMDHVLREYFASDIPNRPTVCASATDGRNQEALPQQDERALILRYEALAPFSRCAWMDEGWQDMETGEPAILFNLNNFTCADADHCTGFAGYTAGQNASMTYRYTMLFENGTWTFERDPRIIMDEQ